jgi:hypothetical protein
LRWFNVRTIPKHLPGKLPLFGSADSSRVVIRSDIWKRHLVRRAVNVFELKVSSDD